MNSSMRSVSIAASLAVTLTATIVPALHGQVIAGSRVRIRFDWPPGRTLVGTMDSMRKSALDVRTDASQVVTVRLNEIRTLEMSTGRHSHARVGAAVGIGVGFIASTLIVTRDCPLSGCAQSKIGPAFRNLIIGTAAGGVVGALVGAQLHADTWQAVPELRLEPAPVSSKGIGIRVSFRF